MRRVKIAIGGAVVRVSADLAETLCQSPARAARGLITSGARVLLRTGAVDSLKWRESFLADETTLPTLDAGAGKTKTAWLWPAPDDSRALFRQNATQGT